MKRLGLVLLALAPTSAFAGVSSTITLTNNYVWRGQSYSANLPAVQGSLDYAHDLGFAAGAWVSNTASNVNGAILRDTETDVYGSYTHKISDVSLSATVYWYTYLTESAANAVEFQAAAAYGPVKLEYGFMPEYFAFKTNSHYVKLGAKQAIDEKFSVLGHVGYTTFGDQDKVGSKNYIDYRVGGSYTADAFTTELAYSNTNRKTAPADQETQDHAVTVSISKTF